MILVDTSIWVDHLNKPHPILDDLLVQEQVLMHPFVIGEISMGSVQDRARVLRTLSQFESALLAKDQEVLRFVAAHRMFGRGIGYIDAHLLVSVQITPHTRLWTRDLRLKTAAIELSIAFQPRLN